MKIGQFSFKFLACIALVCAMLLSSVEGFTVPTPRVSIDSRKTVDASISLMMANDDGVVELVDDEEETTPKENQASTPMFISQSNEIAEDVLNPDLTDPKQTRVIIYIVLSLLPVLFLIPLMLGSRDLIPLDDIPPVQM
ncbi:hypothetical protein CTEN210_17095 [Chaetoceros tenuissimus]|uniref:Transmembrane protein n=1 Tax=Chaetoceros tenuissimus TaxID=426638 RepID=A0AAD3HEW8_9STRA|nr:hypothetical protein CTEN210_17095 [Chaetoceros tenuissimus]